MPEQDIKPGYTWPTSFPWPQQEPSLMEKLSPNTLVEVPRSQRQDGSIVGLNDITEDIKRGEAWLYDSLRNPSQYTTYFRDPSTGVIYADDNYLQGPPLNLSGMEVLSVDDVKKLLPAREYIGGTPDETRRKVLTLIPGLSQYIQDVATKYSIDPNILAHRFLREGFVDQVVQNYNNSSAYRQSDFWNTVANRPVHGFYSLGLDDYGSNVQAGLYNLRREIPYLSSVAINEKMRQVNTAEFANLWDGLEAKAADMEYRKKLAIKRGVPPEYLNAYINAMYNLGAHHKDLNNTQWILDNYSVPSYFKFGGKMPVYLKKFNYKK